MGRMASSSPLSPQLIDLKRLVATDSSDMLAAPLSMLAALGL
jgi:hypothetical protein